MTLTQELDRLKAELRSKHPEETKALMDQATENLANSGIIDRSLKVGDKIPNFTLPNAVGKTVEMQSSLTNGPVVITFYRGQWCPYCNLELRTLQQNLPKFQELGANLIAISPQTPDNSLSTTEKNELTYEVLSDEKNSVAREFGLVFEVPEELRPVYEGFGIDLPTHNGDESFELPVAATYVINTDGTVVNAFVDADYTKRLDPEKIVDALEEVKAKS